jgi:mono/diheme cytochrome c family protein
VKKNTIAWISLLILIVPAMLMAQGRGGAPQGNPNPPTSPVTGNAANGKTLFFNYSCYACHGYNGETGRAFVGNWSNNLASEENFIKFLRGRANVAPATPSTSMPNFAENTLSDKQGKDIYAYIRTFKSNAPPLQNIQTLNEIVKSASKPYKP